MENFDVKEFMRQSQKGKTEMCFTYLKGDRTKEETDKIAAQWRFLLKSNAVAGTPFVIKEGTILWQVDGSKVEDIAEFSLQQSETEYFEHKSRKRYPGENRWEL
mmetsp:Transcript_7338/g.16253  ORF Transcript_7338/g.16253 Transcript_7338/m.16253 type:complete len:104 (+) Transcript_7338:238-549(+)